MTDVVVVGNGPAAHRLAGLLAGNGHRGGILVLGQEPVPAYHRALLGSVLDGSLTGEMLQLPALPARVEVRLGRTVTELDRRARQVVAHNLSGEREVYAYQRLVLATGSRARIPAIPGLLDPAGRLRPGVVAPQTLAGCEQVRGPRVAVLGGGVRALETALALRARSLEVTLLHQGPYPLRHRLDATAGRFLLAQLAGAGLRVRSGRDVVGFHRGTLWPVDGEPVQADDVVLCAGTVPAAELAARSGLACRGGVLVDNGQRTGDPRIFALGDCAQPAGRRPGGGMAAAWVQAERLAATLADQTPKAAVVEANPAPFRVRGGLVEVCSLGPVKALRPDSGADVVSFTDPTGGGYLRIALRQDRIVAATLIGLPHAAAVVAQHYLTGRPMPSDWLAFVLDRTIVTGEPDDALSDDSVLCLCNHVTHGALRAAWRDGACDVERLGVATRAGTGCGGCTGRLRELCAALALTSEGTDDAPAGGGGARDGRSPTGGDDPGQGPGERLDDLGAGGRAPARL